MTWWGWLVVLAAVVTLFVSFSLLVLLVAFMLRVTMTKEQFNGYVERHSLQVLIAAGLLYVWTEIAEGIAALAKMLRRAIGFLDRHVKTMEARMRKKKGGEVEVIDV